MNNPSAPINWTICEHESEWERAQTRNQLPLTEYAPPSHPPRRGAWAVALVVLLVLTVAALWAWRTAQEGLHQIDGELRDAVERDLWAVQAGRQELITKLAVTSTETSLREQRQQAYILLGEAAKLTPANGLSRLNAGTAVEILHLQEDMSIVRMLTSVGGETFRQTRFYQHSVDGWLQIAPQADLLGEGRRLQTEYFVFHYFDLDAEFVEEAAPRLDALAAQMRADYGLARASEHGNHSSYVIRISPSRNVRAYEQTTDSPTIDELVFVDSPSLRLLPESAAASDAIVQAVAYQLGFLFLDEVRTRHGTLWRGADEQWLPLMRALHLWEFWQSDVPLATLKEDIIGLTLEGHVYPHYIQGPALDAYQEVCHAYQIWQMTPLSLWIPLTCESPTREPSLVSPMPTHLHGLHAPEIYCCAPAELLRPRPHHVGLATVLEYAVATYGRERLPVLLDALAEHETWEALIPAVFGVSSTEFEQGWQEYVQTHYRSTGK